MSKLQCPIKFSLSNITTCFYQAYVEIAQRHNLSPVALAIGKLRLMHGLIRAAFHVMFRALPIS